MANIKSIGGNPIVLGLDGLTDEAKATLGSASVAAGALVGSDATESTWAQRVTTGDGAATIEKLLGNTVVMNQLVGSDTSSVTVPSGHKYLGIIGGTAAIATSDGTAVSVTGGTDQLFDLTRMFGAGNEPSTVAEFEALFPEAYYPYDAGSLLSVNIEGVKSVGRNLLDPANVHMGIFVNGATNKIATGTGTQTVIAEVFPNTDYCLTYTGGNRCVIAGVDSLTPAAGDDARVIFVASTRTSPKVFNSGDNRYIAAFIATSAATASNVCINISGQRNGTYEPYMHAEHTIPCETYFPNGMRSAGTVRDELSAGAAVTRIGAVDLGTLTWTRITDGSVYIFSSNSITGMVSSSRPDEIACAKYEPMLSTGYGLSDKCITRGSNGPNVYVRDDSFTDAATFKAAMSGVPMYFPLATPTTQTIDPPLNLTYKVEHGGTESVMVPTGEQTAPPVMDVAYGGTKESIIADALSAVAAQDGPTATANHSVGSYLTMGGKLYKVTSAIASGETIIPGTNVTATTVMAEVIALTQ